jgi:hypothetical protein
MEFEDVKPILRRILKVIHEDRNKLIDSTSDGGTRGERITAWRLEQAVGNHLFDNNPERFEITEQEAHILRDYIQQKGEGKEYIELLHKEFPKFMDEENPRYVIEVNEERVRKGLLPLNL